MKRSRFSEEQIIGILRETQAGKSVKAVWRAQRERGDVLQLEVEVWGHGRERGASASSDGRRGWAPEATGGRFVGSEPDLEGSERKKMVSPSTRRRAVKMSVEEGWSAGKTAAACRALGLARSSYYRESRVGLEGRRVRKEVVELSRIFHGGSKKLAKFRG